MHNFLSMRKIKISKEIKANLPNYPPAISGTSYQIIRLKLVKNLFQLGEIGMFRRKTSRTSIYSRWVGV